MLGLLKRLRGLYRSRSIGKRQPSTVASDAGRRLLLVADGNIATVELYRQVLSRIEEVATVDMGVGPKFYAHTDASKIDVGAGQVLARVCDMQAYGYVQRLVAMGIPYAYALDDNFWMLIDEEHTHPVHEHHRHPLVRRTLEYAITRADVVLCHSEHFRNFLLGLNQNVVVVPTMFNFSLLDGLADPAQPEELRVGVVANSTRWRDMALLVPVVREVLLQRPGVVFEFFGYVPPELEGVAGVRLLPAIADYREYIRTKLERGWLLGLAPLVDDRFAEYKTNNKVREYGACAIAGIYSDTPLYRQSVQAGVTGWTVPNETDAWVRAITAAVDDPAATRAVGSRARTFVRERYGLPEVARQWAAALEPTFARHRLAGAAIESRRELVRKWDRAKVDWPQIATARGRTKADAPGEERDYFRRDVLFMLDPGEVATTEPLAPLAGPYYWGMTLATFNAALSGELTVDIFEGQTRIASASHDLAQVRDGGIIEVRCTVPASRQVRIEVTNSGSAAICLYGVSRSSTTTYTATGASYPIGFAA